MTPLLWRIATGLTLLVLAFGAGWRVEAGRVALHEKKALQAQATALRAVIEKRDIEIQRREQSNADIERRYVTTLNSQSAVLAGVRNDLRALRLRRTACSSVPETHPEGTPPGSPVAASTGELAPEAAEDLGRLASECDATAAQLNALIKWNQEN